MAGGKKNIDLGSMWTDLDRIAIDPMAMMSKGGATSLFGGAVPAGRLNYPASLVPPPPMPDPNALANKIINLVVNDISMHAASYLGEKVGDLLTPPSPADIMSRATSYMGKYVKKPGDVVKELTQNKESHDEEDEKKEQEKQAKEVDEKVKKETGKTKEGVKKTINDVKEWLQDLPKYISQGPAWVEQQVNAIDKRGRGTIEQQIAKPFDNLKKEKEQFINGMADKLARKMAKKTNDKVYKETNEKLKKPITAAQKAKAKAISKAKDALFDLKSKIGL